MEYTQWVILSQVKEIEQLVLILVVMEYTQWELLAFMEDNNLNRLNPCCNGIYSMSIEGNNDFITKGLNPCCNGIYSMSKY